jgi:hypothetical protein
LKKLLLLLPFLLSFSAKSQTSVYHPFPDSNALWRESYVFFDGNCYLYYHGYQYVMNDDTIVNGNSYHKIYKTDSLCAWPTCPDTLYWVYTYNELSFLIREDTNKHIYQYDLTNSTENLLYDFNLNIGDTIFTAVGWGNIVTAIDSVFIDTDYRKLYRLYNYIEVPSGDSLFIIEGLGGSNGLATHIEPFFESGGRLNCYKENNMTLWTDSSLSDCNLVLTTGIHSIASKVLSLSLFPNPFHSTTTLQLPHSFSKATLKIYNTLGSLVNEQSISGKSAVINREGLRDGIYFVVVNDGENEWRGKVVVE